MGFRNTYTRFLAGGNILGDTMRTPEKRRRAWSIGNTVVAVPSQTILKKGLFAAIVSCFLMGTMFVSPAYSATAMSTTLYVTPTTGKAPLTIATSVTAIGGTGPYGYSVFVQKPDGSYMCFSYTAASTCTLNTAGTYSVTAWVWDHSKPMQILKKTVQVTVTQPTVTATTTSNLVVAKGQGILLSSNIPGIYGNMGEMLVSWSKLVYLIDFDNGLAYQEVYLDPKAVTIKDMGTSVTLTSKVISSKNMPGMPVGDTVSCTIDVNNHLLTCKNLSKGTSASFRLLYQYIGRM